ncbi:hypothetical protein EYR40_008670 [Pleurotus pulmonarius]|nr:hypothetical protein EYR40_008670 [Pleurotus pulmonarius]
MPHRPTSALKHARYWLAPPPHFVIYSDKFVSGLTGPPPVAQVTGLLLYDRGITSSIEWTWLSAAERASVKAEYAAAGIKLIVSVFGATDAPTSTGADPISTANTMAAWLFHASIGKTILTLYVTQDFNAVNAGDGKAEAWIVSFTRQLRTQLPQGTFILTHAPVAPWFSPGRFGGGAYLTVDQQVGSLIDWYNVQFYNQGTSEYTTCDGLLSTSSSTWPNSALFQIAASGIPLSKLVIGKPATTGDASNGFMSTATLASCLQQAKSRGWNAGVMVWEFPDAAASWIRDVRSQAFPE